MILFSGTFTLKGKLKKKWFFLISKEGAKKHPYEKCPKRLCTKNLCQNFGRVDSFAILCRNQNCKKSKKKKKKKKNFKKKKNSRVSHGVRFKNMKWKCIPGKKIIGKGEKKKEKKNKKN